MYGNTQAINGLLVPMENPMDTNHVSKRKMEEGCLGLRSKAIKNTIGRTKLIGFQAVSSIPSCEGVYETLGQCSLIRRMEFLKPALLDCHAMYSYVILGSKAGCAKRPPKNVADSAGSIHHAPKLRKAMNMNAKPFKLNKTPSLSFLIAWIMVLKINHRVNILM